MAFLPHVFGFDLLVRHEISPSNISRTVLPRMTKFHTDIHTDIVYSHTAQDSIIYFRSEVIVKKNCGKYCLPQLRVEFLENSLSRDYEIGHAYRGQ